MKSIKVGTIECKTGQKRTGYISAVNRVDGTTLGIPVIVVVGKSDGPVLLVDGGVHGDEQEGTLAITAFAKEIDPQRFRGVFLGVPVMNVGAFEAMTRGNPRDTHTFDMNRIYPGRPNGYLTDRIAHVHRTVIGSLADLEISIHSGGNICYLAETIFTRTGDAKSRELARAMGPDWKILLDTPRPVGSPLAVMTERGRAAITVELGGSAGMMPKQLVRNVEVIKKALANVCRHYDMLEGAAQYAAGYWGGRQQVIQAGQSGMLEPNPNIPLKEPIRQDQRLLRITDLFGETVEELRAPCDGTLFGFRTCPSVTAGDWVLFCADATFLNSESR